jgi:hypothetical protein
MSLPSYIRVRSAVNILGVLLHGLNRPQTAFISGGLAFHWQW